MNLASRSCYPLSGQFFFQWSLEHFCPNLDYLEMKTATKTTCFDIKMQTDRTMYTIIFQCVLDTFHSDVYQTAVHKRVSDIHIRFSLATRWCLLLTSVNSPWWFYCTQKNTRIASIVNVFASRSKLITNTCSRRQSCLPVFCLNR